MAASNKQSSREAWLKAAADELRGHFSQAGYPLPDRLRFAIALTSTGRKIESRPGETWHPSVSADETWEIIIRADKADPMEILGILVHELLKTTLPIEAGHGKLFKKAMGPVGLQGLARDAAPTPLLNRRLTEIAASIGPLPHASLDIERGPRPVARPVGERKNQKTHMRKAECSAKNEDGRPCGYTVRIASKWADIGPPGCPIHGAMIVEPIKNQGETEEESDQNEPDSSALKQTPPGAGQASEAAAGTA